MTEYCDLCNRDITKPEGHFLSNCSYYVPPKGIGYHKETITKGTYGEADKISEECLEFRDAVNQNVKVMELAELSDLVGAIEGYIEKYHPNITLADLISMSNVTKRAFKNGHRN